jgi:sterol desaturase/sphingolipid hydroxylase (fatty acid hydroxylase superfamily)
MGESAFLPKIFLLLGLMAALAVIEIWIPLRDHKPERGRRWRPNLALTLLFMVMNVALTTGVLGIALWMEQQQLGLLHRLGLPTAWAFVFGIVVLDFFAYAVHVLMHKLPWLWRIHRVHHSDIEVDVTTTFRQHPLETMLRFLFTSAPAVLLGVSPLATATYRMLSGVNALFEHANIRVSTVIDRGLRWAVVTPHMHKIHHSRAQCETDSNYGSILSAFDHLLGTYTPADRVGQVRYGLGEFDGKPQSFVALLRLPWT